MNAVFGFTDKKINSTQRTFTEAKTLDVKLKDPCSMRAPVFKVKGLTKGVLYNYVNWESKFYWIDDIVYRTFDIQEVHCHLDALATFKGHILDPQNTFFVKYTGMAAFWNKECDDPRLSPQVESPTLSRISTATRLIPHIDENGTIIMRIMDCRNKGGVRTIAMSYSDFASCLTDLYTIFSGQTIDVILGAIGGSGWRDNILSCIWVPFATTYYTSIAYDTDSDGFYLGGTHVASGKTVYYINPAMIVTNNYVTAIGLSGLWADLADQPYLKNSRWTCLILDTALGSIEIPVEYIRDVPEIHIKIIIDYTSGEILIKCSEDSNGTGTVFGMLSGKLNMDMMGFIGTGETAVSRLAGSFATGARLGAGIASIAVGGAMVAGGASVARAATATGMSSASQIGTAEGNYALQTSQQVIGSGISAISSLQGSATGGGSVGPISGLLGLWSLANMGDIQFVIKVLVTNTMLTDSAYATMCNRSGYPANTIIPLRLLAGYYVECSGASFIPLQNSSFSPNDADISTINSFLNSGLYLE